MPRKNETVVHSELRTNARNVWNCKRTRWDASQGKEHNNNNREGNKKRQKHTSRVIGCIRRRLVDKKRVFGLVSIRSGSGSGSGL